MRTAELPHQWECLKGIVKHVQQKTATEWSSNCPQCGGDIHPSGELPDRFVMFADKKPFAFCRACGFRAFPDQFGAAAYQRPSAEQLEAWRQEQEQREEGRRRSAERALAHLRDTRLWLRWAEMCGEPERAIWRSRGIPDGFQEMWSLGFDHERRTLTIPLFDAHGECTNVKHRYIEPPPNRSRYFYELSGQPQPMFRCNPELPLTGHVTAVEGELKACVTYIRCDDSAACIVGLPGLHPSPAIIDELKQATHITLVLDPGADKPSEPGKWSPMGKLVRSLGRQKCRVLIPPAKIDDMLLAMDASRDDTRRYLRQAKVV